MFGEKMDYMILRRFAHNRNLEKEEDLNIRGSNQHGSAEEAIPKLKKHMDFFEGKLPISSNLRYLDMGCGKGKLTILLAKMGCAHVTGIDNIPRYIDAANYYASQSNIGNNVEFICENIHNWVPSQKYDVLLSFDVFEHIDNPKRFLQKMADFIVPNGVAIITFGPLFHSPFGDHMRGFFRVQIPWRGVLFSEKALLRIRREYYRPTDFAERYKDIVGGLNLMRYSEFERYIYETGWEYSFLSLNASLKRFPPFHDVSNLLTRIPIIRDYLVYSVYAILRRST